MWYQTFLYLQTPPTVGVDNPQTTIFGEPHSKGELWGLRACSVFWAWACSLQQGFALDVTNRVEVPELTARFQMVGGILPQISCCLCQSCCHSSWVETNVTNKREKHFQDNRKIIADSYSFTESNIFKLRDQNLYNRNRETHRVMVENSQREGPVFSRGIKILYFSCVVTVEKGVRTGWPGKV